MKSFLVFYMILLVNVVLADPNTDTLQMGIKNMPKKCNLRTREGDRITLNYVAKLKNGTVFESSESGENEPLVFTVGAGQVIKGLEKGVLDMCEGEKRKLVIPPHLGLGEQGAPPKVPPNSFLVFEVELVKITRKSDDL